VLNGSSSSGKTSLARSLQATLPDPWLRVGVDTTSLLTTSSSGEEPPKTAGAPRWRACESYGSASAANQGSRLSERRAGATAVLAWRFPRQRWSTKGALRRRGRHELQKPAGVRPDPQDPHLRFRFAQGRARAAGRLRPAGRSARSGLSTDQPGSDRAIGAPAASIRIWFPLSHLIAFRGRSGITRSRGM
jgi:Chloramphenicol phosphotransferase-like protein